MLYMIGGPPRMGKSSLAQLLLQDHKVSYVSTDALTVMLKPAGIPSFYSPDKSERFYPYLDLFISRISKTAPNYAIEGDAFTPQHVKVLQGKYDIKCVFLVMKSISPENIIKNEKYDRWTDYDTKGELDKLCSRIMEASAELVIYCKKYSIPYFDLSENYEEQFHKAYNTLLS